LLIGFVFVILLMVKTNVLFGALSDDVWKDI